MLLLLYLASHHGPSPDLVQLEGTWVATSWSFDGRDTANKDHPIRLEIKGDRFTWHMAGPPMETRVVFFAPSQNPKAIDLGLERGLDQQVIRGIYKLEGDTLTICTTSRGPRPKEFPAKPGSPYLLRVLKRTGPHQ